MQRPTYQIVNQPENQPEHRRMRDAVDSSDPETPRLLDEATARRVIEEVKSYCGKEGELHITVSSWWSGSQRWARNVASMTSDQRDIDVSIARVVRHLPVRITTNQIDSKTLKGASDLVNHYIDHWRRAGGTDMMLQLPSLIAQGATVWSDATYARTFIENARAVHALTQRSREADLLSAGYIATMGATAVRYKRDSWGRESSRVGRVTEAQCSATVRHPKATGSGWAGQSSFDIGKVDLNKVTELAYDKCVKSLNPVRIEPGRYQTILEPQAAGEFARVLVSALYRRSPEQGQGPFFLGADQAIGRFRSKLGLKIVDDRINIMHDPTDPLVGTHVDDGMGPVELVKDGVLMTMFNDYGHELNELVKTIPSVGRGSFLIPGTSTSIDDMIRTTKRGLLVTRVSTPQVVEGKSLVSTGVTRDGLWLIEDGAISKSVRNFRWTESPLFIFNNIEEIGTAMPIFHPTEGRTPFRGAFQYATQPIVVPALKVNDFSFTSTIDAI